MEKLLDKGDRPVAATGKDFKNHYAAWVTAYGLIYLTLVTFLPIPAENKEFAHYILGFVVGTLIATALAFVIGSSLGSDYKTKALIKQMEENQNAKKQD